MSYTLTSDISDNLLEMYLAEPEIAIDTEL
ncbi:MAG TPA: 3'-5' exonuclease, partial [Deltaproteobacteria bacterium]|nr:3'-5' exonuclease [Deltaproteobacteria bacterium]